MTRTIIRLFVLTALISTAFCTGKKNVEISGELKQWHRVTLSFSGPSAGENDSLNPFLNYRLNVVFSHGENTYSVPGFFAADGNAGETGAETGNTWRVHFCPDETGTWTYTASFRRGENIAISDDPQAGEAVAFDGTGGSFEVAGTDKSAPDFKAKGRLMYTGERYLKFAGTGEYFIKGGADSPENFLAYDEFDGTRFGGQPESRSGEAEVDDRIHSYLPHAGDWKAGDPVWQGGKGKNIIGALNYLASEGINSVYMLTMNVGGDGKDVWPWTGYDERYRFDCSKLDQWEIVFSHMDRLGIMQHFVTQETENETLLDQGDCGLQRRLYYRELAARFSHHPAMTWNLGEENGPADFSPDGQSDRQRKDMASCLKNTIPYNSFIVVHTHSNPALRNEQMGAILGYPDLDGISMQLGYFPDTHDETLRWLDLSSAAGKTWVTCLDEIGHHTTGVKPDSEDPAHDTIRQLALWGNLMAGGGGTEWYFGYMYPNNDLDCEDWRSRANMWKQTRIALDFFRQHLPFSRMSPADELAVSGSAYCLMLENKVYAVYLPQGGTTRLDLSAAAGDFLVQWYDPRTGGELQTGTVLEVTAGDLVSIGSPPADEEIDWAALISRKE